MTIGNNPNLVSTKQDFRKCVKYWLEQAGLAIDDTIKSAIDKLFDEIAKIKDPFASKTLYSILKYELKYPPSRLDSPRKVQAKIQSAFINQQIKRLKNELKKLKQTTYSRYDNSPEWNRSVEKAESERDQLIETKQTQLEEFEGMLTNVGGQRDELKYLILSCLLKRLQQLGLKPTQEMLLKPRGAADCPNGLAELAYWAHNLNTDGIEKYIRRTLSDSGHTLLTKD